MIYPTLQIEVQKKAANDLYGQPKYERVAQEKVAPVRLRFKLDKTTVRTDSAGSKGHAQEKAADVVVLVTPNTKIALDDKLIILGNPLRVIETHPRFTVSGKLDHVEVWAEAWV